MKDSSLEAVKYTTSTLPEEMSNEDIAVEDPIRGFLEMQMLTRLRCILEVVKPLEKKVVQQILNILFMFARHSQMSAQMLMDCPRLLSIVSQHFIESQVDVMGREATENVYSQPRLEAFRLIRALCQSHRDNAAHFLQLGLFDQLKGFLAIHDTTSKRTETDLAAIQLEVLRIWRVSLSYGVDVDSFAYMSTLLSDVWMFSHHHHDGSERSLQYSTAVFASLEALARQVRSSNDPESNDYVSVDAMHS
jgi:hypothetical protein